MNGLLIFDNASKTDKWAVVDFSNYYRIGMVLDIL